MSRKIIIEKAKALPLRLGRNIPADCITSGILAEELGISSSQARKKLTLLVERGDLKIINPGGVPRIYQLVE